MLLVAALSATVRARVADIVADPAAYVSRTVTVLGEVEERVGPGLFSLDEDAFFAAGIDNDLLVVAAAVGSSAIDEVQEGQMVQIRGVVRQLVTVEFEREFGLDLDDELVADFEGRPVIMASAVQLAPRD